MYTSLTRMLNKLVYTTKRDDTIDGMGKTFLLGVGCQKGGTTWLFNYLKNHPDCGFPLGKELHIFDVYYKPERFGHFVKHRLEKSEQLFTQVLNDRTGLQGIDRRTANRIIIRLKMLHIHADLTNYLAYFNDFLCQPRNENIKLIGDITPSYGSLDSQHFREINKLLERSEFDVKVVFIMRDPIERIYSVLRMDDRNQHRDGKGEAENRFGVEFMNPGIAIRTRYEETIVNLRRAFRQEQLGFFFFETLFQKNEIRRMCQFLGIDYARASFRKKVNATITSDNLDKRDIENARQFYAETYAFCAEEFGEDFIRRIWRHY